MFLKFMFWYFIVGIFVDAVFCCMDHPRQPQPVNLGVDMVDLVAKITITVFMWFYAFGGWVVK
jgi:hypothetical protein